MRATNSALLEGIRPNTLRWGTMLVLALAAPAVLWAQSAPASDAASPMIPYTNPTYGFEMQLPAGWRYDHGLFQGPEGALGLIRGESRDAAQALQVLVFRSPDMPAFDEWLAGFEARLRELHKPHAVVERRRETPDRPRVTLTVNPQVKGIRSVTHYLCVPFDPNTVWVLVLAGAVAEPAQENALQEQFDQIAASLRVLYDATEVQEIGAALRRGLTVLDELRTTADSLPIDPAERFYNITIAERPIGYMTRWMRREQQTLDDPRFAGKRKEGLHVREESWRFADDGTVRCTELNLFSSLDLKSELIENKTTQVPAPDLQSQRLYIELDQCVRENQVLFSSFTTNLEVGLPDPRPPLPVGPGYLDLAWLRVLPRLLLKAPSERYAFWVYDSQARALAVHRIRPLGPGRVPGTGRPAYVFETQDGFAAQAGRMYTDARGNVVRIESGDLALTETTPDQVERLYAERRAPARRRMQATPPHQPRTIARVSAAS